jgi:two-component system chemotaxis response regulator CheY
MITDMARKVLIVDDSAAVRQLVGLALKGAGYEVVEAVHGRDALEKLGNGRVDMMLTDLNMPEMDGIEFIKAVRSTTELKFTPIVMLTTEAQEAMKQEGKMAGASGWIVKPFKSSELIGIVKKFIK